MAPPIELAPFELRATASNRDIHPRVREAAQSMILEAAVLNVRSDLAEAFEAAFRDAETILSTMPGYISHELQRCVESESEYLLLVRWETIEAHTEGFRGSPEYARWKALLHHFYDPFPTVFHYRRVSGGERVN